MSAADPQQHDPVALRSGCLYMLAMLCSCRMPAAITPPFGCQQAAPPPRHTQPLAYTTTTYTTRPTEQPPTCAVGWLHRQTPPTAGLHGCCQRHHGAGRLHNNGAVACCSAGPWSHGSLLPGANCALLRQPRQHTRTLGRCRVSEEGRQSMRGPSVLRASPYNPGSWT